MANSNGNKSDKQPQQKKLTVAIVIGAVAIIVALVTVIVVLLNREPIVIYEPVVQEPVVQLIEGPGVGGYVRNPGGRGFVVTEDNVEEVRAQLAEIEQRLAPEDMRFEFSKSPEWRFATSQTPSRTALVRNVENNSRTVFFDVYIEDFGVVYVSPYMPIGSEHRNFALDVELPAGTYTAVVTYFLVDDDLEILTDVSVGVTIIIES